MQEIDRISIEEFKIPSLSLMENAAKCVVEEILNNFDNDALKYILVIAGKGNNGGDAICVSRILKILHFNVKLFVFGKEEELSEDAKIQANLYKDYGKIVFLDDIFFEKLEEEIKKCSIIVDGLLGTGTRGRVSGEYEKIINLINASNKRVVSIDIPSGLSGTSFYPSGPAIKADLCVTFQALKIPLITPECEEFCGKVVVKDIGLSKEALERVKPEIEAIDLQVVKPFFKERDKNSHKGTFGHLLIIAGSKGKNGAAILCAKGALKAQAGLVTVATPESISFTIPTALPEAMTLPLPETKEGTISIKAFEKIEGFIKNIDAIAIGPGLTTNEETKNLVKSIYKEIKLPMVVDADAINAFSDDIEELKRKPAIRILTPHPGELSRIFKKKTGEILEKRYETITDFSKEFNLITCLKGYKSIISDPKGFLRINTSGGPYMAQGGSGDVLTGIVGALLARGIEAFDAISVALFWHGLSAFRAFSEKGYGVVASEVSDYLPLVEAEIRNAI